MYKYLVTLCLLASGSVFALDDKHVTCFMVGAVKEYHRVDTDIAYQGTTYRLYSVNKLVAIVPANSCIVEQEESL